MMMDNRLIAPFGEDCMAAKIRNIFTFREYAAGGLRRSGVDWYPYLRKPSRMKFNLFMTSVLVVMLSMVVSKIVYFGFTPNYGADIFSHRAFDARFDHGGDRYRVLSKYLVYGVDGWLSGNMKEGGAEARVRTVSGGASERFYYAIYYVNTLFLALTSLMVVLLLNLDKRLN